MAAGDTATHQQVHALYRDHHGWLCNWLQNRLGCSQRAADLAQDTFLRLLARRTSVTIREPRAFLSSIARGLVIDHWRRREVEQAWQEAQTQIPAAAAPPAEESLQCLEVLVAIDKLLDELKPRVRTAFILAQLEGLTCPQIAERLSVSRATVERDLARALRHCYSIRFVGDGSLAV